MFPNSTHLRPNLSINGFHSSFDSFRGGQLPTQPLHFSHSYSYYPIPPPRLLCQANNPSINIPTLPPLNAMHQDFQISTKIELEAPEMPRDPDMLKNIDVLSSFVVKNGINHENMLKQNQANNPKFGFLFESEPGTEAAIGRIYYEWKKSALRATFQPRYEYQAPSILLNQCSNFFINNTQKETSNRLNQDSISYGEIDMDIEGIYTILLILETLRKVEPIYIP